jgi:hypothetical protein
MAINININIQRRKFLLISFAVCSGVFLSKKNPIKRLALPREKDRTHNWILKDNSIF